MSKLEALANLPQTLEKFTQEAVQRIGGFIDEGNAARAAERAAAQQRAVEGGFSDEVFYHASKQDIDKFVPGYNDGLTFLTPNPEFANNWLGKGKFQERQGGTGSIEEVKKERKIFENQADETLKSLPKDQQTQYFQDVLNAPLMQLRKNEQLADSAVYPVRTKVQKIFNPNKDWKEVRSFLEETQGYERNLTTDEYLKSGNYLQYENKEIRDFLESKGYDAMRLSESSDGVLDTLAVFNPQDIRSVNAQFDPAKRNSSKLLASAMGVGVLGTAALAPREAEAGPINIIDPITGLIRKGIEAYHGTGAKFSPTANNPLGEFDDAFMGTGEGAQAYGVGHYQADARGLAKGYQEQLTRDKVAEMEVPFIESMEAVGVDLSNTGGEALYEFVTQYAHNKGDLSVTIADARRTSKLLKSDGQNAAELDAVIEAVDKARVNGFEPPIPSKGSLYRSEIDIDPDTMLDWDKPLSEQSESVQSKLEPLLAEMEPFNSNTPHLIDRSGEPQHWSNYFDTEEEMTPRMMDKVAEISGGTWMPYGEYSKTQFRGESLVDRLTGRVGRNKENADALVSQMLNQAGIPGVRYLDGDSRNRPIKDIQQEFLSELPDDASIDEVVEMLGTGAFSPKNEELISALADDDWLGFDFPAQSISTALGKDAGNYDVSARLSQAVKNAQVDNPTSNYVVFDPSKINIKERGMATPAALAATAAAGGAGMAMMGQDANAGMASIPPALDLRDIPFTNQPAIPRPEEVMAAEVNEQMQEGRRSGEKFTQLMSGNRSDRSGFFAQAEALLGTVNGAIGQGFEFVGEAAAIPVRGVLGANATLGSLAAGQGLSNSLQAGANRVNAPLGQSFDEVIAPALDLPIQGLMSSGVGLYGAATGDDLRTISQDMGAVINNPLEVTANRFGEATTDKLTAAGASPEVAAGAGALVFAGSQMAL